MLGMFHQAAGRLGAFVVSSMLVVGVITSPAQQMVTDTRDPSQTQDEEFERLVKQWTTQPYFISPLVDHLPRVPGVPSPKDVLGYHVGAPAKLTYYADLLKYYRALATAVPARVRVETIGKSDEERELVVVWVSSDENMRDLERNRSNLARLADPRGLTPEQIKALITSTKPHYHLMGGLHSGETGPSEMLVELVYRLATETSPLITQIRENVVVSVTPVADPDGRDRNVDWFYRNLELFGPAPPAAATPSTPAAQSGQGASTAPPGVPYWGKYVHHDNNRDINLSQQSMRALAEWYFTAHPPIMHDLHESLPLLYTYSGGAPQNPNLDPILFAELPWFSNFELAQMTKWGMPGVYTHAFMDGWSPGYLGSIAYNHNGMMRMYETQAGREDGQGGGRGGEPGASGTATGIEQGRGGAATTTPTGRGGGQQREWYRGIPIPPGSQNTWSRRNNTNYMQTGVLSALQLTAAFPNLVIDNFYRKTANSIEAGKTEAPHGFVIPVQRDMTRVAELVNILRVQRIEVGRATSPIKTTDGTFPAGSYVIKRDQPYGRLAKNLLEKQSYPDPNLRTYDDSGWTMGLAMLVEVKEIRDKAILSVATTPVTMAAAAPTASAAADKLAGPAPLAVSFTGTGADADGDPLTYAWDFTDDGTVDAATANASHTYDEPGEYTAKFTVSDGERSRSVEIDIEAYPPLASCPGNDQFDGTTLDTARWRRAARRSVPLGRRRIAQPQRPAGRGHPRRRERPAQHRAPGPARLRRLDRDGAHDLEPDGELPERRPRDLHGRRELDQERHGVGQRPRVRGLQGAQQLPVRPRCPGRRRVVPEHVLLRFTTDGTTVRAQRSADGETWVNTGPHQPQRPDQPEDRHVRNGVDRRGHARTRRASTTSRSTRRRSPATSSTARP